MVEPSYTPTNFLCPITNQIMEDPVIAADGIIYERKAINMWLESHNSSPQTGKKFENLLLTPNDKLKIKILKFREQKRMIASSQGEDLERLIQSMRSMINAKEAYIEKVRESLALVVEIKKELKKHILNCKIANTSGNSTSVAGTGLLFSPLALVGLGMLIAGGLTSLGTTIAQSIIEKVFKKKLEKALLEEEKAKHHYEVAVIKVRIIFESLEFATKAAMITTRFQKIINAVQILVTAGNTVKTSATTAASAGGIISKVITAGKFSKGFAIAGAALSVVDIALTWTLDNETLQELKSQIEIKREIIKEETEELHNIKNICPN